MAWTPEILFLPRARLQAEGLSGPLSGAPASGGGGGEDAGPRDQGQAIAHQRCYGGHCVAPLGSEDSVTAKPHAQIPRTVTAGRPGAEGGLLGCSTGQGRRRTGIRALFDPGVSLPRLMGKAHSATL